MNQAELDKAVSSRKSVRQIASEFDTSVSNVRYWLRKYGLKTYRGAHGALPKGHVPARNPPLTRTCSKCGESDVTKFYGRRRTECMSCHNADVLQRGQEKRERILALMGGRCTECGYDTYGGALDLHHVVAGTKDVAFKTLRYWSWERILEELPKCVLLCKNCHAYQHHKLRNGM